MAAIDDTIEYYVDLLLYQYINSPKARSTISLLASQALVDLLPVEMNSKFNIETAIGDQLDILGEYIGLSRIISVDINRVYLIFFDQTDLPVSYTGLTDYLSASLNYEYSIYTGLPSGKTTANLSDDEYRRMLQIKLLSNTTDSTLSSIDNGLYTLFGNNVYIKDYQNMTINYFSLEEYANSIRLARDIGILPRPMGVDILYVFTNGDIDRLWNMFSWDDDRSDVFTEYSPSYGIIDFTANQTSTRDLDSVNAFVAGSFIITNANAIFLKSVDCLFKRSSGTTSNWDIVAMIYSFNPATNEPLIQVGTTSASIKGPVSDTIWVTSTFTFTPISLSANTRYYFIVRVSDRHLAAGTVQIRIRNDAEILEWGAYSSNAGATWYAPTHQYHTRMLLKYEFTGATGEYRELLDASTIY